MVQDAEQATNARPIGRKRQFLRKAFLVLVTLLLVAGSVAWVQREDIADDVISSTLRDSGVLADYDIELIEPGRQVLTNVIVGDPAAPDLTIERVEVLIEPQLGYPTIREVRLTKPRLFGSYRDGQLSFGALDPLIFTESDAPFEFPAMVLGVNDGRALMDTDFGRVGIKLAGGGHLRGGFSAELAAITPELLTDQCRGTDVSLYGTVSIDAERPQFDGPLRIAQLECADADLSITDIAVALDLTTERNLVDVQGNLEFAASAIALAQMQTTLRGEGQFAWRDGDLTVGFDLVADDADTAFANAGQIDVEGRLRALQNFSRIEVEGDLAGEELRMGGQLDGAIASLAESGEGTLIGPLADKFGLSLARSLRGSTVQANFTVRSEDGQTSVIVPRANLRSGSGASILALSRGQLALENGTLPRFSGNIISGGEGLPYISGRMEQGGNGAVQMQLSMRDYTADTSRLALPSLTLRQTRSGSINLDGSAIASGEIPGGQVSGLALPIQGVLAANGSLAMWGSCTDVAFDALEISALSLAGQSITLCPKDNQPILRSSAAGIQMAAIIDALDVTGDLSSTPLSIATGPVSIAYPGAVQSSNLNIALGEVGSQQLFAIDTLNAELAAGSPAGSFAGMDITLDALPLDLTNASGQWVYADGQLTVDGARVVVSDRTQPQRFAPMFVRGADLSLIDNRIRANALLRHPATDTPLSRVAILHDLSSGRGSADLSVDGLTFRDGLQPVDLTVLALGVVANVDGTIAGGGRIDWNADEVTSSGVFSSERVDLAAAFGPVQGASGTIVFEDLLGLTTAPDQVITVAAVNPGIEVYDGEITFELSGGELLTLKQGVWPFMGGTITMSPVGIRFGVEEEREYRLEIEGLQASQFVERMELGNLAASGTFNGTIPVIFDAQGNGRLERGVLTSAAPGGHVSYVGELTYEDMSFFANYAFNALRDLRYERMEVVMDGPLTGELVTQVRFDGIAQGETAQSNIVTRAIADLPIELRINIRAPFYKLITSIRALYDPSAVRDPRSLGLLTDDGVRLREAVNQQTVDELDAQAQEAAQQELLESMGDQPTNEPDIQPQESEAMP